MLQCSCNKNVVLSVGQHSEAMKTDGWNAGTTTYKSFDPDVRFICHTQMSGLGAA